MCEHVIYEFIYTELLGFKWSHHSVDGYVKLSRSSWQAGVFGRDWLGVGPVS